MLSEDERYRTSSQYRLWSYTPSSLLALRKTTNRNAADRVHEAVRRVREARAVSSAETSDVERDRSVSAVPEGDVDCLTAEEELKLVVFYCRQTAQLGDHLKFTTDVKVSRNTIQSEGDCVLMLKYIVDRNPIYEAFLPNQLPHDLPPNRHP